MSLQEQIMQLLILLKKSNNKDDKKLIKNKLKSLYNKLNTRAKKPKKMVKFNLPYKEEIKEVLNPLKQQFLNLSQELKQRKNDLANQIIKKEQQIKKIKDEDEKEKEKEKLERLKDEKEIIDVGIKNKQNPAQVFEEVNFALNASFPVYAKTMYLRYEEDDAKEKILKRYLKENGMKKKDLTKEKLEEIKNELDQFYEKLGNEILQEKEEKLAREELKKQEAESRKLEKQRLEQARKEREAEERRARREAEDVFGELELALQEPKISKKKGFASALPQENFLLNIASGRVLNMLEEFNALDSNFELQQNPAEYTKLLEKFAKDKADKLTDQDAEDLRQVIWQKQDPVASKIARVFTSIVADKKFDLSKAKSDSEVDEINAKRGVFSYKLSIDPATEVPIGQAEQEAKGQGKRKRKINYNSIMDKIHGGAGIADWMLTLGSIPGVPQLMNNMGPFGQILGNASGLAQTFGKTAGQLLKEQSKSGEKVAGFTDALGGPLKAMVGFGKSPAVIRKCQTHLLKGGSLKDFWNKHKSKLLAVGIPTAAILGSLASIKIGDKMIKDKNKALGIVERVKPDFFSKGTIEPTQDVFDEPQPFTEQSPLSFKWGGRGLNMADVSGGAFLSDFLGTIGGITPKISGLVGAVPTYGKVATIGNSVLGSASRVGEDIAKMLGLGNMDMTGTAPRTKAGHGNMDLLGKTKGYGRKKGGRKMLPYGRPMPRFEEMATIQPYGMPYGGFGLTDALFDATGDLIKGVAKGAASGLKNIGKDLAKTGIQKLADTAVQSIGKGRRKKVKGGFLPLLALLGRGHPEMSGCGKVNGKYVSSEYESNYEDALSRNRLFNEMARMSAEQQMEQAILNQQNMEQQSALSQLEYHNLLRTIQQQNQ